MSLEYRFKIFKEKFVAQLQGKEFNDPRALQEKIRWRSINRFQYFLADGRELNIKDFFICPDHDDRFYPVRCFLHREQQGTDRQRSIYVTNKYVIGSTDISGLRPIVMVKGRLRIPLDETNFDPSVFRLNSDVNGVFRPYFVLTENLAPNLSSRKKGRLGSAFTISGWVADEILFNEKGIEVLELRRLTAIIPTNYLNPSFLVEELPRGYNEWVKSWKIFPTAVQTATNMIGLLIRRKAEFGSAKFIPMTEKPVRDFMSKTPANVQP